MPRQAYSLDVLLAEINTAAPNRSTVSDGGIGDAAHASRDSDHNPNAAGVWRARDFTHDPAGGLDCNVLADALVAMYHAKWVHPAMRSGAYTIWNGRIYSYDRRAEGWRPYTGSNPHDKHLHQSVATAASGYDSRRRWRVFTRQLRRAKGSRRFVVVNLAKQLPGTWRLLRLARKIAGRRGRKGYLVISELLRGKKSTQLRGRRARVHDRDRIEIGTDGAHRWAAVGTTHVAGVKVRTYAIHGLHYGTLEADQKGSGRQRQQAYYQLLDDHLDDAGKYWIVGGDLNVRGDTVAAWLNGKFVGQGVDGLILSPALAELVDVTWRTDARAVRRGWTDHHPIVIDLTPKEQS